MSKFIIFLTYLITFNLCAQQNTNEYAQVVEKTLSLKVDSLKLKSLKQISSDYDNTWLTNYYVAQLIIKNSMPLLFDEDKLKVKLKEAQSYLDKAYAVDVNKNDEAELLVMQAKLYVVYVMSNGEKYGRAYAPTISKLYNKAYNLAPKNPRVLLSKTEWEMGMAKYFGSSTEDFCKSFEEALNLYETFQSPSKIHPNWGLDNAKLAVQACEK